MQRVNLIWTVTEPTLIKVGSTDEYYVSPESEPDRLIVEFEKIILVRVYPTTNSKKNYKIPFVATLETRNGELSSNSPNLNLVRHMRSLYEIIVLPQLIPSVDTNIIRQTTSERGHKYEATFTGSTLTVVQDGTNVFMRSFAGEISSPNLDIVNSTIILSFKKFGRTHIFMKGIDGKKSVYTICDRFKTKDNEITTIQNFNDYDRHLKIAKYTLDNDATETDKYTAFAKERPPVTNEYLIPTVFAQNVVAKDTKNIRRYLTETFSKKLTDEHILEFFGKVTRVIRPQISLPTSAIALVERVSSRLSKITYYDCEIKEGLISNIKLLDPNSII